MKKKNLSRFDKIKDTIKMEDFVIRYLNDEVYVECYKLTYKQLKSFDNPYVVTVSYEFAETNIELILSNKILLVSDRFGNIAPYINPLELKKLESLDLIEEEIKKIKKIRINQLSKLVNLWGQMQILLYQKDQIEGTINILEEINRSSKINELGGKTYVKKYQGR